MNEDDYYHRHPSMLQKSYNKHQQQYSSPSSPNLQYQQKSSPKYVPKIKNKHNNNDNQSQINDPAIMNMGNASSFSHSLIEIDNGYRCIYTMH